MIITEDLSFVSGYLRALSDVLDDEEKYHNGLVVSGLNDMIDLLNCCITDIRNQEGGAE
jgi:hypothetical protein